jgi:hypothetical protein
MGHRIARKKHNRTMRVDPGRRMPPEHERLRLAIDRKSTSNMAPLLRAGLAYDVQVAGSHVREALIMRLSA